LRSISKASGDERKLLGKESNLLKKFIEEKIEEKEQKFALSARKLRLEKERIDITLDGKGAGVGSSHPVSTVMTEVIGIFSKMGFSVKEGPEIETDYYNFEALNIPKNHPARDMQDTFYISEEHLLRTHTSPVQIHSMEKAEPPIRLIAPGKVYRCDADVTHSPMFHQIEGFMVDKKITFGDLKGVLELFIHLFFGKNVPVRFRPSFFPFTEPSAEVDIGCVMCLGKGCRICSQTGWLEILGSGLIDPAVFHSVGYDPEVWSGFAFGVGIERLVMLKYCIDDIRLLFENDIRFLKQF
ncbi:MAG: phenylalanine--tRNA ligase subunit alpha, partial [Nitrospinota bacterium]